MGGLLFLSLLWLFGASASVGGLGLSRPAESRVAGPPMLTLARPSQPAAYQAVTPAVQLTVTPAVPTANQAITISAGGVWPDGCVPVYKTHQVTANEIKINAATPTSEPCGQAITPWALSVVIDVLPPGVYQVDLFIKGEDGAEVRRYVTLFTVTPAAVTQLITSNGGELTQNDEGQRATVTVPPGSVVTSTLLTMRYQPAPITTAPLLPIGHFVALTAVPTTFTQPFTLTLRYSDTLRGVVVPNTVALYRLQGSQWVTDGITITTRLTDGLTAQIAQLAHYGLLGRTNRLYFPVAQR